MAGPSGGWGALCTDTHSWCHLYPQRDQSLGRPRRGFSWCPRDPVQVLLGQHMLAGRADVPWNIVEQMLWETSQSLFPAEETAGETRDLLLPILHFSVGAHGVG